MASWSGVPNRIMHVSDCYLPRIGGIELQVAGLTAAQIAANREVHVVTTTAGPPGPRIHRVTAPFYVRALSYELPVDPAAAGHLDALFGRVRPDVVHVHLGAVAPLAWIAARRAVAAGLPLVISVHSTWGAAARGLYAVLGRSARWTRWPMVLTPVSRAVAAPLLAVTGGRVRQAVVPNGLDVGAWRRSRPGVPAPRPDDGLSLVTVGRLAPRKRVLALVRILRAAQRSGPARRLRMTVVGDGPVEPLLRGYLARHRMAGSVRLLGGLDRDRLPQVLAESDVFVAPAAREAFGLAALEARAAGLPVIAHERAGVADFVTHGRDGLLCADDRAFTDAIVRLARDDGLRAALAGASAAGPPSSSDWPQVTARFDDCYAMAATLARLVPAGCGGLGEIDDH